MRVIQSNLNRDLVTPRYTADGLLTPTTPTYLKPRLEVMFDFDDFVLDLRPGVNPQRPLSGQRVARQLEAQVDHSCEGYSMLR